MSVYRLPSPPPVELVEEGDPFRQIKCVDCGAATYSAGGEDLCASCDFKWLRRGIDWGWPPGFWNHVPMELRAKLPRLGRKSTELWEHPTTIHWVSTVMRFLDGYVRHRFDP